LIKNGLISLLDDYLKDVNLNAVGYKIVLRFYVVTKMINRKNFYPVNIF